MNPLIYVAAAVLTLLLFAAYAYVLNVLVRLIGKRMGLKDALAVKGPLVGLSSVFNPLFGKKEEPFGR